MESPIDHLKHRARVLQKLVAQSLSTALAELRELDEFRNVPDSGIAEAATRRDCLAVIAKQLGFPGWPPLLAVMQGARLVDFGTLLVPAKSSAFWNIWFADYEEASRVRAEHGGYLLAYRRQFFVADADYIRHIGLDPDDSDWTAMNRDWPNTTASEARARQYLKLIQGKLPSLVS